MEKRIMLYNMLTYSVNTEHMKNAIFLLFTLLFQIDPNLKYFWAPFLNPLLTLAGIQPWVKVAFMRHHATSFLLNCILAT